jgi:hypothetical protein
MTRPARRARAVAHSIARAIPRWRKACASLSSVAGSEK